MTMRNSFLHWRRRHPEFIRYEGPINDRARLAKIYRAARGFVSVEHHGERLSLSALEEPPPVNAHYC
jgi:ribosomal protein L15E